MKPGDVALVRPRNLVGQLVADFDNARYCHARLITDTDGGTVEADVKGAIRGNVRDGDVIIEAPLSDTQRAHIAEAATGLLGTPYGFLDIAALAASKLGLPVPYLKQRIERPDRLFCSQLVDIVWQSVGYTAFTDGRTPQDVTPGDIADKAFTEEWPTTTHKEN